MKIAIIGGTFNPPHMGHLLLAEEVLNELGYDRVLFIPSNKPAHKTVDGDVSASQRMEMVRLAIGDRNNIQLEACEILRGGVSYSIDTVNCVLQCYDLDDKPGLVIGDDLFQGFDTWKDARVLGQKADLIVAHRLFNHKLDFPYPHTYLNNKILPLSSSEIRERIRYGKPWRSLVPEGVYHYINDQKLYLQGDGCE